jgi:hypothetical protein
MTIHLSCGHEAEDGCLGVCVEYADEQCVAGEGFVSCTVEAVYCHKCAMDLAAAEERAKIVAYLEGPEFGEKSDWNVGHASEFAWLIKAKEHLK